jgi:hypothetical protein
VLPCRLFLFFTRGAHGFDGGIFLPADGTRGLSAEAVFAAEGIVGVVDGVFALEADEAGLGVGLFEEVGVEFVGTFGEFNGRVEYLEGLE